MLVEVRPLPIKKFHGKEETEDFAQPKVIEVLYDNSVGGYATGLTKEDEKEYSDKLGLKLDNKFKADEPHEYWSSTAAQIKLPNHTLIFNTEKPLDYVKVQNLKASKFVANSMKEWKEGKYGEASHVIFDEKEEVEIQAKKINKKNTAIKLSLELTSDEKVNIIQILSNESTRGRSSDFLDVEINKIIENKVDDFIKYAKMNTEESSIRARVLECILKDVLTKEGTAIYYMGDQIAIDYEEAVKWFMNPQNQQMKVSILEKLNEV